MSNRIIKDTIAITVITLVAGLALGVVQDITADPIAKQEAQAKQDAYKAVFADADSFDVSRCRRRCHCSLIWMRTDMQHSLLMRPCLQKMLPAMNWDMHLQ